MCRPFRPGMGRRPTLAGLSQGEDKGVHDMSRRVSARVKSLTLLSTYTRGWRTVQRRVHLRRLMRMVDAVQLESIRRRHPTWTAPVPRTAPEKYLDVATFLEKNMRRVQYLGLHRNRKRVPPQRILDLGCGGGFFLFICKTLGHECTGLDVGDVPLYDEMLTMFGVHRVSVRIEPFVPLPAFETRFDWVTAFATEFNRYDAKHTWAIDEWAYFLADVRRLLAPGGRLFLDLNPTKDAARGVEDGDMSHHAPDLVTLFQSHGAVIDRWKILFPPNADE